MDANSPEEAMEVGLDDLGCIMKGKRTKRHRQFQLPAMVSSSSDERILSSPATTTSDRELGDTTDQQDEDMANCLILLAQSGGRRRLDHDGTPASFVSKRGPDSYECKTCSKCFPTFQALGGHRASHTRPKVGDNKEKAAAATTTHDDGFGLSIGAGKEANIVTVVQQTKGGGTAKSPPGGKGKLHECSICGSVFTSGQALGGHMRRHRIVSESPEQKKLSKNVFALDLNLPAPADSDTVVEIAKLQPGSDFAAKQPVMFAAMVDCHN